MGELPSSSLEDPPLNDVASSVSNRPQGSITSARKALRTKICFNGEQERWKPRKSIGKPKHDFTFTLKSLNRNLYLLPLSANPACLEMDPHRVGTRYGHW